ncbi:MAG: ComEA family DNA-binding protein [Chloroflexota bacterium]|nr:MAG: ComEA family DNA-binding protein [Chloroflexota bacterium]
MLQRWTGAPEGADDESTTRPQPAPISPWVAAPLALVAVVGAALWLGRAQLTAPLAIPTDVPAEFRVISVHVVGAIARPGVYQLRSGERLAVAIERAGGALPEADLARVNLAARARDGQQILVPTIAIALAAPAIRPTPGRTPTAVLVRVNLNQADIAALDSLPGVGAVTARRIIEYRQKNGPFADPRELRSARLVTAAAWERLKDLVDAP